jgi:hypothetical protein
MQGERSCGRFLDVRRAGFVCLNALRPVFVAPMPLEKEQSCRAVTLMLDKNVDAPSGSSAGLQACRVVQK